MSHAKSIFLIALVIFFVVLFVAAYVWMRRPDFGQKGGRPIASPGGGIGAAAARRLPRETGLDRTIVPTEDAEMSESASRPV
jgi:hypothetical protein